MNCSTHRNNGNTGSEKPPSRPSLSYSRTSNGYTNALSLSSTAKDAEGTCSKLDDLRSSQTNWLRDSLSAYHLDPSLRQLKDCSVTNNDNSDSESSFHDDAPTMRDETEDHEACQTRQEGGRRRSTYTLEEMCDSAKNNDGEFDNQEHEMEIAPGHYVKFRGAKETWRAVHTNQTTELQCLDCLVELVCINDCEYTVCPDCRVVNPVLSSCYGNTEAGREPHGVGMGLKKEWVLKKQLEQQQKYQRMQQFQREHQAQQQQKQEPPSLISSNHMRRSLDDSSNQRRRVSFVDGAQARAQLQASAQMQNGSFGGSSHGTRRTRRGGAINHDFDGSSHSTTRETRRGVATNHDFGGSSHSTRKTRRGGAIHHDFHRSTTA